MRKILLFIVLCCCINVCAQRVDKPGEPYDYYCYIYWETTLVKDKIYVVFPGQERKRLVDEEGKAIKFKNSVEVLTYFSKRGWVFVSDSSGYRMKKSVTSDEQALEHLNFKE